MISRVLLVGIALCIGMICQLLLFKTEVNTYLDALRTWPGMWVLYFAIGHIAADKLSKLIKN